MDAGVLETLGAFSEPRGFGHVMDEDGLGGRERIVFGDERLGESFEGLRVFGGENFEIAVVMAGKAVGGMVLRGDGLRLGRFGAGGELGVGSVGSEFGGGDFFERRKRDAGFGDADEDEGLGFVFFFWRGGGAEGDGYGLGWGVREAGFTGGFTGCVLGGTAFFAGDHMCVAPVN